MKSITKLSLVLSCLICLGSCKQKQAENTFSDEIIPVKIVSLKSLQSASTITATGLITTASTVTYSFKIGGIISKICVQEGSSFKKGQLLAFLNPIEINSGLAQNRLAVEKANRDYIRASNLYKDSVETLEQLQNARTALDIAQKAEDAITFNAQYSKIYALTDGFVAKKIANEGEVVAAGAPILATNENSDATDWTLKLGVTDKEWAEIKTGQTAEVSIDAFPGQRFKGTVYRKSQAADQNSGSFEVELKLLLADFKPALGMFAKASINTGAKQTLTAIPFDALIEADGNTAFVYIPDNNSHVKRIPVIIDRTDNQLVYVKSGLQGVDDIIVSNSAFLNEKSTIKIIN